MFVLAGTFILIAAFTEVASLNSTISPDECEPILEIIDGIQNSEDIYEVKYTKMKDRECKFKKMEFISDRTNMKVPADFMKLDYGQQTLFFWIKSLNVNESYTLNITYGTSGDEFTNSTCTFSIFSRFIKHDVTNQFECDPLLEIKKLSQISDGTLIAQYTKKLDTELKIVGMQFVSDRNGAKFPAHLTNVANHNKSMFFSIIDLDSNEPYTLNITYEYELCTSSTFSNFTKRNNVIQAKMNNINLFIAVFVIASFVITLMFIYTGQKSKLEVLHKKIKSLIFPWYSNSQDTTSQFSIEFHDSFGRQEINPLYQPLEQYMEHGYDHFEFPREKIEMKTIIGQGDFGEVWYAKAYGIFGFKGYAMVAVKRMKNNFSEQARIDFLMEINTLKKVGKHKNVVEMLACVTTSEPYMIIMELIRKGNLKDYLLEMRKIWEESKKKKFFDGKLDYSYIQPDHKENENNDCSSKKSKDGVVVYEPEATTPIIEDIRPPPFPVLDHIELQSFASQIASGMAHLETIGITHRDLAARNILITKEKLLKITDFGMSRPETYVNINMNRKIPLRWCSIEVIKGLKTTNKSDVWSFGVVLWEIGTLVCV
ncbi:uncharacterized protein isoform X2 [Leptinotarsa decemlineata]|uniref:uncharacterized protein isoform X2 n=1 Tax=Leptinotarsa decemlineata TaxID=7539 RepID=UPI003D30C20E